MTALKLVFHLRGVRGTGKSDKENFYYAALWMQQEHPQTLLANLAMIAEFGYFKDLLELVLRIVEGPDETHRKLEAKETHKQSKCGHQHLFNCFFVDSDSDHILSRCVD